MRVPATPVPPLVATSVPASVIAPDVAVAGVNPVVEPLNVVTPVAAVRYDPAGCLLLNVVQSVELNAPLLVADAVGTFRVIIGVVVPVATEELRSVPVVPKVIAATLVTVPEPLLLKVFQSVDVKYPDTEVVAAAMLMAGVVPPLLTTGAVPVTLVTVP